MASTPVKIGFTPDITTTESLQSALTRVNSNFSALDAALALKADASAIPTKLSSLTNDKNFITTSDARSAISVSGALSYNAATGIISYTAPTIPTALSALTNDTGFITQTGARNAISVAGSLSYSPTTGVISYTAPTLGSAATLNVGTTAGTVAAGNDTRITGAVQKANNLSDIADTATARTNLGLGTNNNVQFGGGSFSRTLSVTTGTDAIVQVETTGVTGRYTRKQIFSSVNVQNGDAWLFRSVRPSDGAIIDYTLSGNGGSIWTSGNIIPLEVGTPLPKRITTGTIARQTTIGEWNGNRPLHLNDVIQPGTYGSGDNIQPYLADLAARARERNTSFVLPTGVFLCNGPVDIQGTEIIGAGHGVSASTKLVSNVAADVLVANGPLARGRDFQIEHDGAGGCCIALNYGDAHHFERVAMTANNSSCNDPMMQFFGSNIRVHNVFFTNMRSANSYCLAVLSTTGLGNNININNVISHIYMGGSGRGIRVGSFDGTRRPEGTHIISPMSIVTGGPAIVVECILHLVIVAPMLDQVKQAGILVKPTAPYGVDGLQVIGGWIGSSPQTDPNAVGIILDGTSLPANTGIGSVTVDAGTAIRFLHTGINVSGTVGSLNIGDTVYFNALASGIGIDAPNLTWIKSNLGIGDKVRIDSGNSLIRDKSTGRGGRKKSRKVLSFDTNGFSGYIGADHGLVAAPGSTTFGVDAGTTTMFPPTVMLAQKDLNNFVANVNLNGVVTHGTAYLTVDMEV